MLDALERRGPDGGGLWFNENEQTGVALAHRRLAVIDPSDAGAQPITSPSGRYQLTFNGEIYNHLDLRAALTRAASAPHWRGGCDAETLVAAFDQWGVKKTLTDCAGMFALAVWDNAERRLVLARDRMGEKPLAFGWTGAGDARALLFASDLNAILAYADADRECARPRLNRRVLADYLRFRCVPEPDTIFEGFEKVRPGEMVTVDFGGDGAADPTEPRLRKEVYWSAIADAGTAPPEPDMAAAQAVDRLDALLTGAVDRQTLSDVPLGAFLSGGVDSATIVALMAKVAKGPVRTFSVGFDEDHFNEAPFAKAIAAHLNTEHTEFFVDEAALLDVTPKLARMYDEPFADASQIPTHIVAAMARAHVTVALSGDGGDELFAGYRRYQNALELRRRAARTPRALLAAGGALANALPLGLLNGGLDLIKRPVAGKESNGQKLRRLFDYLQAGSLDDTHRALMSAWLRPEKGLADPTAMASAWGPRLPDRGALDDLARMQQIDMATYLPGDILTKVDRATMFASLESRAPLLDHRVVEFALSLPTALKLRGGQSKWILRQVLDRYVPRALIERPKMGFEPPIAQWLRTALRDWAGDLLAGERLKRDSLFNADTINHLWSEHQRGESDHSKALWPVLMMQQWLDARPGLL